MESETDRMTENMKVPSPRIRSVEDFCRRYRLDIKEKQRLMTIFGPFAAEQDLLLHATRTSVFS